MSARSISPLAPIGTLLLAMLSFQIGDEGPFYDLVRQRDTPIDAGRIPTLGQHPGGLAIDADQVDQALLSRSCVLTMLRGSPTPPKA
jgi:hypothetical protein